LDCLGADVGWENETLRFPTTLDREAIISRLVRVRSAAETQGLTELAAMLGGAEQMSNARLGVAVVSALSWLSGKSEHQPLAARVEIIAVNLKNL